MTLVLITGAASYPITVAEAKANGRIEVSEEDTLIEGLIAAATAYAERVTGMAFIEQTWEDVRDRFPSGPIVIDLGPVTEVVSVKYIDADGDEQTIAAEDYTVDTVSRSGRVYSYAAWPATKADTYSTVRVRFTTGGGAPDDVKQAILLLTEHWYENRASVVVDGTATSVPMATDMLLGLHRRQFV